MVGCQFLFLLGDMYHQLNWFTVGIFLASLLAIAVVTNLLGANQVEWKSMWERSPQTSERKY